MKRYFIKMTVTFVNVDNDYFGYSFEQVIGKQDNHLTYKIIKQSEKKVYRANEFNYIDCDTDKYVRAYGFKTKNSAKICMEKLEKRFSEINTTNNYNYTFEIIVIETKE